MADEHALTDGIDIAVTGEGRALEAIKRMILAHTHELNQIGWMVKTEDLPNGVGLVITTSDTAQVAQAEGA